MAKCRYDGSNQKALKAVNKLDTKGNFIKYYFSIAEANRDLDKPQHASDIVAVLNGRQNTAYGFKWELA